MLIAAHRRPGDWRVMGRRGSPAKALAMARRQALDRRQHLEGHAAVAAGDGQSGFWPFPYFADAGVGGSLPRYWRVEGRWQYRRAGDTIDDGPAACEAFRQDAKILGLGFYPGGPQVESKPCPAGRSGCRFPCPARCYGLPNRIFLFGRAEKARWFASIKAARTGPEI